MQIHPFLKNQQPLLGVLPSQNVSLKDKQSEKWQEENMRAISAIAMRQFQEKRALLPNYKLANGEIVVKDFVEKEGYSDVLDYVEKELQLPNFVKPYDIISQPLNTLLGEMDNLPDIFHVSGKGDIFDSMKQNVKTRFLHEWFMQEVEGYISAELQKEGYEENPMFENEQQQQEYDARKQALTPPEIERYINTSYKHVIEIWAQKELEDQFERYRLRDCRRKEFFHWLVSGSRFRHIYVSPRGLEVETENSLFVFSQMSIDTEWVQDGDLAGIIKILSIPAFIDKYGHQLKDNQLDKLQDRYDGKGKDKDEYKPTDIAGRVINYTSIDGLPYMTPIPSTNAAVNLYAPRVRDYPSLGGHVAMEALEDINGPGTGFGMRGDLLYLIKAYWKSQRRIGKLTWINPESGLFEKILIDESFQIPKYIKSIKNEKFQTEGGLNTIIWTRVVEVWEGTMVQGGNLAEPIFFNIQPAELQIGKLLIAGQFANNINTKPTSFIDKIKDLQFFYTVIMNQCFHQMQTEILPFIAFDMNMIHKDKDWGGEDSFRKWIELAQALGLGPMDTTPQNIQGANPGGQLPKVIDLDRGNRIIVRMNLAGMIRQLALEKVGMSPQRLGDVGRGETATGITQSISNSYTQTSVYFKPFFSCERDILQMQLDCAKKLQGTVNNIASQVNKADLTQKALEMEQDTDLYTIHVYVNDSQKEARDLDLARRLAVENNTSTVKMSDRLNASTMGSVTEILESIKASEQEMMEQQQQAQQLEQQKLQQAQAQFEQQQQILITEKEKDRQMNIEVATIRALGFSNEADVDNDGMSDVIQYRQSLMNNAIQEANLALKTNELNMEAKKTQNAERLEYAKLQEAKNKRIHENEIQKKKIEQARIQGDKSK